MTQQRPIREITTALRDLAGGFPQNHSGYRAKASDLINELAGRHPEMHKYIYPLSDLFFDHFSGKRVKRPINTDVYEITARINSLE